VAAATWASPVGVWIFVVVLGGWLVTLCLHEFGHAVTALMGGDTSVRDRGYLTLNPMRYSNFAMTFVVPLIILAVGGFPLPGGAVLIEHGRIRSRLARSAVSLAGPAVNVVCGVLLAVVSSTMSSPLGFALAFLALLQFIVAILNLLPIPGLDGWGALTPFLSAKTQAAVRPFAPWAPVVLIVVLISMPQVAQPLWDASYWVFELAGGDNLRASLGASLFQFWR
jgi:Zn-dependent protease